MHNYNKHQPILLYQYAMDTNSIFTRSYKFTIKIPVMIDKYNLCIDQKSL